VNGEHHPIFLRISHVLCLFPRWNKVQHLACEALVGRYSDSMRIPAGIFNDCIDVTFRASMNRA
jgi:hypothetical protein